MKLEIGAHPSIPHPFTNAPQMPTSRPKGLPMPPRLVTQQMEQGLSTTRAMLSYWTGSCEVTLDQFAAIASWGMGERAPLDKSGISRMINGARGIHLPHLLAFDHLNEAIWTWQVKGQDAAWEAFGPPLAWKVQPAWVEASIWLPHPDDPRARLTLHDFVDVLVGRLPLPYADEHQRPDPNPQRTSEALSQLLNHAIGEQRLTPRDGIARLLAAYPVTDEARRQRLRGLILGEDSLSREELNAELMAVAEALRVFRGLEPESYGPMELAAELDTRGR